jgi:hypothetical protein
LAGNVQKGFNIVLIVIVIVIFIVWCKDCCKVIGEEVEKLTRSPSTQTHKPFKKIFLRLEEPQFDDGYKLIQ